MLFGLVELPVAFFLLVGLVIMIVLLIRPWFRRTCPRCRNAVPRRMEYCVYCGKSLRLVPRWAIWSCLVSVIVVVAAVAGVVAYFLVRDSNAPPRTHILFIAVEGNGTTDPAAGAHTYNDGDVVSLSATAGEGYRFVGWEGGHVNSLGSATATLRVYDDITVTACFEEVPSYTLTMAVDGNGSTDPPVGAHTYYEGDQVDITAIPGAGHQFDRWDGDVDNALSASATAHVYGDMMVIARFSPGPNVPSVTTDYSASSVTGASARLQGSLTSLAYAPSVQVSFEWGTTPSYGNETAAQAMIVTGGFYFDLGSLSPGTTYYYRAKAVGNGFTGYGTQTTFTTTAWVTMTSGTTNYLYGVWGSSASDVFAVGAGGTILHYNGTVWTAMTSSTSNDLYGVWGSSGSNVFAVGNSGTILRYNGTTWSSVTSGTGQPLYAVWGSSASNAFAVGNTGTILRFNGTAWSSMTSGTTQGLRGIWGSSAADVFAVGVGGVVVHYNGSKWENVNSGTTDDLRGVCGSSSANVFAVGGNHGQSRTILHYNGSGWSQTSSGEVELYSAWGDSGSGVFAAGGAGVMLHYNGSGWSQVGGGTNWLYGIWGTSAADVFAVGANGTIMHYGRTGESPSAGITAVDPVLGVRGQTYSVTVTGTNLNWATAVSFGPGVVVNAFTVDDSTRITVNITIDANASPGTRDVSVNTPSGTATKVGGFAVG